MTTRFYIWVTSDCNLRCPYCIQEYTMKQNRGYQMQKDEIDHIVRSCLDRGIHFETIEFTGGEASLWQHLEYGYHEFSKIADMITLATNGNNPDRILALGMKTWIVSESQATAEQMAKYNHLRYKLTVNAHQHKKLPDHPMNDVLPALCCTRVSPQGEQQRAIEYIKGKVYNCPDCYAHLEYVPLTDDLVCDFEADFMKHFEHRDYNKEICRYCLGNNNVWNKL